MNIFSEKIGLIAFLRPLQDDVVHLMICQLNELLFGDGFDLPDLT
jgi:hypothetical protein